MCHQLQQENLGPQTVRVGVAEEIVPLAVFDDVAAVHEDDAVADHLGKSHLVRDDHHRHACLCHQDHHVQNLAHHLGVQRAKVSAPVSAFAKKFAACCCTRCYSMVCSGRWHSWWTWAPPGAADQWLACEAPEEVTSDVLKPRAEPPSPHVPPTYVSPPQRGRLRGLGECATGRFGAVSSGPRMSLKGRNRKFAGSISRHSFEI